MGKSSSFFSAIIIIFTMLFISNTTGFSQNNFILEKAEPLVRAQLAESLSVTGVHRVKSNLSANGEGAGVLIIDDWNSAFNGSPHGNSVLEVVQAIAPEADVWLCKLDFTLALMPDFVGCLQEMETRGLPVQIVNMSFSMGDKFYRNSCGFDLTEFGREIHRFAQKGVTFIGAAGNQGVKDSLRFPACHSDVISVGATYDMDGGSLTFQSSEFSCKDSAELDKITCYSNVANYLDILAPGTTVSTPSNSRFGGTSASAPIVTGIAALMISENPSLRKSQLLQTLRNTGKPVYDAGTRKSYSRVDAFAAVSAASSPSRNVGPSQGIVVTEKSIVNFDRNGNGTIEDLEFFSALESWISMEIDNDVFFQLIDVWTSQVLVQRIEEKEELSAELRINSSPNSIIFSAANQAKLANVMIYDAAGRPVYRGSSNGNQLRWDVRSSRGSILANGVYFYTLLIEIEGRLLRQTGKMAVIR
jgi:subtilisin family serine protease